jgi:hypothetical protein
MEKAPVPPLMDYFKGIKDPRIERNKAYPLIEIIAITILAVMAFAEGWEDIETYGLAKQAWLKSFSPCAMAYPNMMCIAGSSTVCNQRLSNNVLLRGRGISNRTPLGKLSLSTARQFGGVSTHRWGLPPSFRIGKGLFFLVILSFSRA